MFNLYDILSKCGKCIWIFTYTWPKSMVYNLVSMLNFWGVFACLVPYHPPQPAHGSPPVTRPASINGVSAAMLSSPTRLVLWRRFFGLKNPSYQWSFRVPLIGGRYHIITQLAVHTTYIQLIYCQLGGCMLPTTY